MSLYKIYEHQQNKEYGKVVSQPDVRYDKMYNNLLIFLNQLRTSELSSIAYRYVASKKDKYLSDEDFFYAYILASKLPVSNIESKLIIKTYQEKYPKGKYLSELNRGEKQH
jgi:hypothetical protein